MSPIQVKKLGGALGAEVSGIDLSRPVAAETFAEIRTAWLDHLVLRFRGQTLSDPQLMAFSELFGELDPPGPNPYGKPFLPEHPEMNVISNIKMGGARPERAAPHAPHPDQGGPAARPNRDEHPARAAEVKRDPSGQGSFAPCSINSVLMSFITTCGCRKVEV
jgi:hypothetical protein